MMKKFPFFPIFLINLIIWLSVDVYAQEKRVLTLEDCIRIALKNNSQLRNADRKVNLAGANVLTSYSAVLPNISTSFASGRYIQGPRVRKMDVPTGRIDPETGQMIYQQLEIVQDRVSRNSHYARVSLYQNIFDWGRSWNGIKQANAYQREAEHTLVSTRQAIIYDVRQKYFELLKAVRLMEVYKEALNLSEEQLKRTESMYEIGSVALADVYKARVNVGNAQINLITQKNLVTMARADLNVALGQDPDAYLEIVEIEPDELPIPYTLEEALQIALGNNPELKSLEEEVKASEYGLRIAKAAYLPSVGASISYSRDNEFFDRVYNRALDRDYSVSLGIGIDLNIFNGFADKAEVDRQSINYHIARENLLDRKRIVKAQVKQAFLNLQAFREIADINRKNLVSAEEDLRLAQERYRVGAGTLLETIDAQVSLTQARSNLIRAEYDAKIALAQLEAAMGVLKE